MAARLGNVIWWGFLLAAIPLAGLALLSLRLDSVPDRGLEYGPTILFLVIAALVVLCGRAIRYVLAGR